MVEKKTKKKATLDDVVRLVTVNSQDIAHLARITAKGFVEVHEKMDTGFKKVRVELDEIKGQLAGFNRRLEAVADNYGPRIQRLEKRAGLTPMVV